MIAEKTSFHPIKIDVVVTLKPRREGTPGARWNEIAKVETNDLISSFKLYSQLYSYLKLQTHVIY